MRVFIAEKPSVAKAIAEILGATNKKDGYIECGSDYVTWCFGHMYEQAEPDVYTPDNVPRNESGKKSGEKMICQLSRKSGLLTLVKMLRNS